MGRIKKTYILIEYGITNILFKVFERLLKNENAFSDAEEIGWELQKRVRASIETAGSGFSYEYKNRVYECIKSGFNRS